MFQHDFQAHAKEKLQCCECGEMFPSRDGLTQHTATSHPTQPHHAVGHHDPEDANQGDHLDHRDYQIDTNFSLSSTAEDFNLFLSETPLNIADSDFLNFPSIDETPAGHQDPPGKEGSERAALNSQTNQISTTSTSPYHYHRDKSVIRFCKHAVSSTRVTLH